MDENDGFSRPTTLSRSSKVPPPVPKKKPRMTVKDTTPVETGNDKDGFSSNPLLNVSKDKLLACDDLTRLPVLYDETVLTCILERYAKGIFYTWAGPTLVAVNPCRPVEHLYSANQIKHHLDQVKSGIDNRDAHVYSVAGLAHHRLAHDLGSINQAILVSGESGAGKTESARYMLGYLTSVEARYPLVPRSPLKGVWEDKEPQDIQNKILASNPILEAFGNASTLRNHNSSRFGKLIHLQYGGQQLKGAEVDTYLLEKTRVTRQPEHERNFHIFYQLLAGIRTKKTDGLLIYQDDKFAITPGEVTSDDFSNFQDTLLAFQQLDFTVNHQKEIFKVMAALLHLGNITFTQNKGDSSQMVWTVNTQNKDCMRSLSAACQLLGIKEEKLIDTITIHTFSVGTARKVSVFHKPCEREAQCVERRDALMQLIYESLFHHIVKFINRRVSAEKSHWSHFLGILDVYGFETFDHNSLEQLCINYANERLQQEFMQRYLATEHQVLREEGFMVDICYSDNSKCVMALDSPVSVFTILNEECQLKREVKEEEACDRVCKALERTGIVYSPSSPGHTSGFVVKHYAGLVKYDAEGLLHKNKDEVPHEVTGLLASSNEDFIGSLLSNTCDMNTDSGRRTTRKITTLSKFKASLDTLVKTLSTCDLHYVRCVKPNAYSLSGEPDGEYVMHQLKACGVIETVCISQAGYPVRISYEDFIMRYGHPTTDIIASAKEIATAVLCSPDGTLELSKCRFGYTRVFLSESALHTMEEVREKKRNFAAVCLQKYWRGHKCALQYRLTRGALLTLQKYTKTWVAKQRFKKLKRACVLVQRNVRKMIFKKKHLRACHAAVIIQKYFRGWVARRKYESLLQQCVMRPFSRQSVMSMNSLGYYSLATSASGYSLTPSLHDVSPTGAMFSEIGAFGLSSEVMKLYLSPEHRQRILETEESGIETDTESINGDANHSKKRKSRKLRRKAHLQRLLGSRGYSSLPRTASNESLDDQSSNFVSLSSGIESSGCQPDGTFRIKSRGHGMRESEPAETRKTTVMKTNTKKSDYDFKAADFGLPNGDSLHKLRVATMHSLNDWSGLLKTYSPTENLQMVLPKQNLSLFFRDGVLSYRRMPVVGIKFHTRPTCLPFSHHLPHRERPQGLWDILR